MLATATYDKDNMKIECLHFFYRKQFDAFKRRMTLVA